MVFLLYKENMWFFHIDTIILNKVATLCEKCDFRVKITIFINFSLSAKFNRFFIILGGVQKDRKNTIFGGFGGPKTRCFTIIFSSFFGSGHTGGWGPIYCGEVKIVDFEVKMTNFGGFISEFCSMRKIRQICHNYGWVAMVTGKG